VEDAERKKKAEEAQKKAEAEAEAKRKAEAEAQKQAEYEKAKKQFGDSFGDGKGKNDKPGNQGDPNGDPDATKLDGISTGSGMVGGGLGDRGVVFEPKIKDDSQKTGTVVVRVCVNRNGEVISADYTQKGSTTADSELRQIAITSAKKFKFSKSSVDKQCGTITIDFKVR
jgi:TonB family protein